MVFHAHRRPPVDEDQRPRYRPPTLCADLYARRVESPGAEPMFSLHHILFLSVLSGLPADPPASDSSKTAKGSVAKPTEAPAEWNETRIAARIRRTEESKELKPEEKLKILELYKSAQNGFKKAEEWKTRADSMERLSAKRPKMRRSSVRKRRRRAAWTRWRAFRIVPSRVSKRS